MTESQQSPTGLRGGPISHRGRTQALWGAAAHTSPHMASSGAGVGAARTLTCLVRLPPRFMVPEPDLLVCSHSITVEVSL